MIMDCGARFAAAIPMEVSPAASAVGGKVEGGRLRFSASCASQFQGMIRVGIRKGKSISIVSADSNKCRSKGMSTPLVPESPAGKFLSSILNNHPHIFPAAAAQQLENLASERDSAIARRDHSVGSSQACLHQRISEMKEDECGTAVEEVMYMMIVHRFSDIKVSMSPHLSWLMGESLDTFPSYEDELQSVYDQETLDMVKIHLLNILSWTSAFNDSTKNQTKAQIRRLHLGRIYAASVMYGYFLKSASLRHRLEYLFSLTSKDYPMSYLVQMPRLRNPHYKFQQQTSGEDDDSAYPSYPKRRPRRIKNLKSYITKFDSSALRICAKLQSREAANLIEKHSRALFLDKGGKNFDDEQISVAYSGLKHLVLEAVTFGSFLWDVERYADSVYGLSCHL